MYNVYKDKSIVSLTYHSEELSHDCLAFLQLVLREGGLLELATHVPSPLPVYL